MALAPARRVPTPASGLGVHLPDDRFIPLRPDDLVDALAEDAEQFGCSAQQLRDVAQGLDRVVAQEMGELRREVERAYDPHNPARDTLLVDDELERWREADHTRRLVGYLLDKANYEALDDVQVNAAVGAGNSHGIRIRVNPDRIDWIELWVRGRSKGSRAVRTLRRPIKGVNHEVELYQRLAVVFRAKDGEALNLKLFREIPVADVEALLPHAEVEMSPFDRLKVFGGSLGALGGLATKLFENAVAATQLMWVAVVALCGLSVRSFLGYRRAKHTRLSQMTHHLYYQNVANNAGVLDRLVANIGHEELKEAVLTYALAHRGGVTSEAELSAAAAQWLRERFDVHVDFDGPDAVQTLERMGVWSDREAWCVHPPAEAIAELTRVWKQRRTAGFHLGAAAPKS
ncbi:MAG: DUF3754 domain-containing protein [Deltaproteobacteria bacterium]|nr:DUF3754 domain-containing protein [Deltaproteobacteria bacterium]